jgi:hypothetical protein
MDGQALPSNILLVLSDPQWTVDEYEDKCVIINPRSFPQTTLLYSAASAAMTKMAAIACPSGLLQGIFCGVAAYRAYFLPLIPDQGW